MDGNAMFRPKRPCLATTQKLAIICMDSFASIPKSPSSRTIFDDGLLVIDGYDGESVQVQIRFVAPLLVRVTDESSRLRSIDVLHAKRGTVSVQREGPLIDWLVAERLGIDSLSEAAIYTICLGEEVIDVVALDPPVIDLRQPE
jgi:hypothetical protein